jgi:hypothetical protein
MVNSNLFAISHQQLAGVRWFDVIKITGKGEMHG